MLLKEGLDILRPNHPIILQIAFVAHQQNLSFWRARIFYFCVPVRDGIFEGLFISDIKDDHECMCATVVWAGNGPEALMASGVPNLQLDLVAIERKWLEPKVNADRSQEDLAELVIGISYDNGRLSNARVAD